MEKVPDLQSQGITCGKTDYSIGFYRRFGDNAQICEAKKTNNAAINICQQEGGTQGGFNLITPVGHKAGYFSYSQNYP
jgi:hypothetical protein